MEPVRKYIVGLYRKAFDLNRSDEARVEDSHEMYFDGNPLLIDKNNPQLFISPDFDWGSRSRGSRQAAVSILLQISDTTDALRYSDMLVNECLAMLPSHKDFRVQVYHVKRWLNSKKGQPDQETDILYYTKIDDPQIRPVPPKPAEEKKPLIIEPPAFKNTIELPTGGILQLPEPAIAQKGGNGMTENARKHKWPFSELEVGQYFYFINPTPRELKLVGASQSERSKTLGRTFVRRVVSSQWCRENGLEIPQNVEVCIVWRTA